MKSRLLDDPLAYWEQRHQILGAWRAGGDRGLPDEENFEFYTVRLGKLIELIRRHTRRERPLQVLDAGCGSGHFTDGLRRCGHRVVGIDASATAIERARSAYGDLFEVARLDGYAPRRLADVIVCIDVLFHVLDDATWRAAIGAFARYASAQALVIVTDVFPAERYAPRDYIVHRTRSEYEDAFAAHDFQLVDEVPYQFGANPIQFAAYRRAT